MRRTLAEARFLAGRTALVTGAVGGLGAAMARSLASAGANVMIGDLASPSDCQAMCAQLAHEHEVECDYHRADLAQEDDVAGLVDATIDRFGSTEILVNNAVVRHFAPIAEFPLHHWNRALAVNLTAAFIATQRLLPVMQAAGYGRIFNLTSVFGSRGTINRVDYVTTKTAIQGFTRAVALEVAGGPISCHALTPGTVLTPSIDLRINEIVANEGLTREDAERKFLTGKQPSGRFVDPASITEVMLMLCGPAGLDMNGAILPIEGGWLAQS